MGVYINMKMPKSCTACQLERCQDTSYDFEFRCCPITGVQTNRYFKARHPDCPLVPVPPHGDLIDRREAIIDANERAYDFWLSDDEVNATIQFLKEQTTIIPASEEGET